MTDYKEIFKLKELLEKAGIPFIWKEHKDYRNGYQILYPVDGVQNICSVIEHSFSYGNEKDLLEIRGLMTKEEEEEQHDSVLGFLTAENVFERIGKHFYNRKVANSTDEKEAEERFVKSYPEFCYNGKPLSPYWDLWQDGAEFGYNKAKVEVEDSYRESLCNAELNLASVTEQLEELKAQIEKMKCCQNCFFDCKDECPCGTCTDYNCWELRKR